MNSISIVVLTEVNGYVMGEETNIWFCCTTKSTRTVVLAGAFRFAPWTFWEKLISKVAYLMFCGVFFYLFFLPFCFLDTLFRICG